MRAIRTLVGLCRKARFGASRGGAMVLVDFHHIGLFAEIRGRKQKPSKVVAAVEFPGIERRVLSRDAARCLACQFGVETPRGVPPTLGRRGGARR